MDHEQCKYASKGSVEWDYRLCCYELLYKTSTSLHSGVIFKPAKEVCQNDGKKKLCTCYEKLSMGVARGCVSFYLLSHKFNIIVSWPI